MKLKKINGSVTHLFELPDNVARQMLAAHPTLYFIDEEKKKEHEETEEKIEEKIEEQVEEKIEEAHVLKAEKKPGRKPGKR